MYHQKLKDGTTVLQMNSEIQHAHLELLSAHCAVHQLRLHYSSDDLVRFGRGDVLRKSAEAATALHEFYSGLETRIIALPRPPEAIPEPTPAQIAQAVEWVSATMRQNHDRYSPLARPLTSEEMERFSPYFSDSLLRSIRIAELHGKRLPTPDFFSEVRAMGYDNLPDIAHMDSVTFLNLVVFNQTIAERPLFHGLVHSVQIRILGLEHYAELWVRGFAKSRAHFTVPLEVQAFSLAAKFALPGQASFSVENDVLLWSAERRY